MAVREAIEDEVGHHRADNTLKAIAPDFGNAEQLTEYMLRRIMRVAVVVGAFGIGSAALSPSPINGTAMGVAIAATFVILGMTFLPVKMRILSHFYPWALCSVGVTLAALAGPRPDSFLLIAGGVFVGSLVLSPRGMTLLALATCLGIGYSAFAGGTSESVPSFELWRSALSAMIAVVIPTAAAGRMLVGALARILNERQGLIDSLEQERQLLRETVQQLETTRNQLTHAQKVELIGQLAGGIAHDMNNALTSVIGEASLLDDRVAEERERIVEAGMHAAKLTGQLMMFGRRDTSRPRPLDLGWTIRGFVQSVRRLLPSDVALEHRITDETLAVVADPTQLLQVILNLTSNAKDAMAAGGRVTLEVTRAEGPRAAIRVSDTGTGIAEDQLDTIFEPFFTTKPPGKGTGLGLSNVRHLVEELGGTIGVTSRKSAGTTFEILLPLTDANVEPARQATMSLPQRSGTILIVDDDVRVRAFVYSTLERCGYQVLEASTVSGAEELLSSRGADLDLLITDVVMPEGGGAQVISMLGALSPKVPVLILSGYADDEALTRGIAEGKYPFLPKPFTAAELSMAVDQTIFDHHQTRTE